jgi:3-deoxy-7-phosphoheptulonate synthase
MIVTMRSESDLADQEAVVHHLRQRGYQTHVLSGSGPAVIGVNGRAIVDGLSDEVCQLPGVNVVSASQKPYMLAQRKARPGGSIVQVGNVRIGTDDPVMMAGTCVIESREITLQTAEIVKAAGGTILRGGAFKPRTSPYSFQGLGEEGLQILAEAREKSGLPVVTEVMEPDQVEMVAHYADMLQIGSRNMSNFPLLRRAAAAGKPILLKRGFSATIEEWLMSAEYVLAGGNDQVVLCERGIRSFDTVTRFTLDLNAVPVIKELTHLPIVVDPSHGTGRRELVAPMALAGIAAGAHGLIVEMHPDPDGALCDAAQTISPSTLREIIVSSQAISEVLKGAQASLVAVA